VLGNVAHYRHPLYGLRGSEGPTLEQFIHKTFAPWTQANRPRSAANTLEKLHRHFGSWFSGGNSESRTPAAPTRSPRVSLLKGWAVNSAPRSNRKRRALHPKSYDTENAYGSSPC